MPKISPISLNKLIKILEKSVFKIIRQKGSHLIMMNNRKTRIVIPMHSGKATKPGLVRAIIREAGTSREKLVALLKER